MFPILRHRILFLLSIVPISTAGGFLHQAPLRQQFPLYSIVDMPSSRILELKNIPYTHPDGDSTTPASEQTLDLYIPKNRNDSDAPARLIFFVHGGAWVSGDKVQHTVQARLWVETFASSSNSASDSKKLLDTVVAVPNYRLSPSVKHPAHASDIYDALAFLLSLPSNSTSSSIPKLQYDEIWLVGHSAGAHIAPTVLLSSSFHPPSNASDILSRVTGVICLAGIYDIDLLLANQPWTQGFVVRTFGDKASYRDADSTSYALPAHAEHSNWTVVFSKDDELADIAQSEKMYQGLLKRYGLDGITGDGKGNGKVIKDYTSVRGRHDPLLDTEKLANFVRDRVLGM